MSINVFGQEVTFNKGATFYGGFKLYGTIDANEANFTGNVNLDALKSNSILVKKVLNVGNDGSLLKVEVSKNSVLVGGNIGVGNVTDPEQRLDIDGSIKIDKNIFDSANTAGENNYFLSRDGNGIRWVSPSPKDTGIQLQDEGTTVPIAGIAQTFSTINFVQSNSLGLGTDTLIPTAAQSSQSGLATIFTKDLWGYNGSGDSASIYRMTKVGIQNNSPTSTLDVTGTLHVTGAVDFDNTLNVSGLTTVNELKATGIATFENQVKVTKDTQSTNKDTGAVVVEGGVGIEKNLNIGQTLTVTGNSNFDAAVDVDGATTLNSTLDVDSGTTLNSTLDVDGATTLNSTLDVDGTSILRNTLELESSLIDVNQQTGVAGKDYRLSSVGTGVSWRPSGVETLKTIWVSESGNDANSGLLEGDAKRTVGAAAAVAQEGDTIVVRPGVYDENNPIGLRTDVSVTGQDLRLVTIRPQNLEKDIFHVRRGCLIENLNFSCNGGVSVANTGGAAVAFPPPSGSNSAVSGYTEPGPATEGSTGRWRSPYIRNCTNFMTKSIGMKIDGDHATVNDTINNAGNNLKSMVCDSFTQYNEAGIGVSITNEGYAQLVSIFTINCDIGIYADTGGQCDLTNSNSSFGNYGLYAVGLGRTQYTGTINTNNDPEIDTIVATGVTDSSNTPRRPFDGQAVWFKIDIGEYPDATGSGRITSPLQQVDSITVTNGGSGYSQDSPPIVVIRDGDDDIVIPKGPQGIAAEASATVGTDGTITAIDVVNSGRNYLSTQNVVAVVEDPVSGTTATATVTMSPIYFTVSEATGTATVMNLFKGATAILSQRKYEWCNFCLDCSTKISSSNS
jgi:aspartate 1-decarboxylase